MSPAHAVVKMADDTHAVAMRWGGMWSLSRYTTRDAAERKAALHESLGSARVTLDAAQYAELSRSREVVRSTFEIETAGQPAPRRRRDAGDPTARHTYHD